MGEEQRTEIITKDDLVKKVSELKADGFRLVQIGCTRMEDIEVNYSFDRAHSFLNLRLAVPREGAELPSISGIYWNAFLYENEMHDLFGISVKDIAVDYEGNFYRMAVKTPFNPPPGGGEGEGKT